MAESITITDNRTGESLEIPIENGGISADAVVEASARHLVLRPGLRVHRRMRELHHLPRRRRGHPPLPRLSHRAAGRAVDLPRGGLPAAQRRAAHRRRSSTTWRHEITQPHLHPRERAQAVPRGLPLRRPPHGHAGLGGRRPLHLLPRRQGHLRRRVPQQADHPAHRQDAHPGRRRPPVQRGHALRLPRQLAALHLQLPLDDVEDRRAPLRRRPRSWPGPSTSSSSSTPTTSRTARPRPCGWSGRRTPIPTRRRPPPPPPSTAPATGEPTRRSSACSPRSARSTTSSPSSPRSRRARAAACRASATASTRATTRGPRSSSRRPTRCSPSPARTRCSTSPSSSRRSPSPTSTSPRGKLYPNVDFYSGLIYQAMGFPLEMFPVLFAIPRTAGWLAHWQEMLDQDSKIARPRQLYIGAEARDYVTMAAR